MARNISVGDIGGRIREARKQQGVTQQQLADLSNVSCRFISDLEAGKPTVEAGLMLKVLETVGLDVLIAERNIKRSTFYERS